MVMPNRKSFGSHLTKIIPNFAQRNGTVDVFDPCSGISRPTSRRTSACPNLHEWGPIRSHKIPSCSAIDLTEIRRSSKISSWIWSIIHGVITVLCRLGRGASQVEKLSLLNWATQFLTVAYYGAEWREFPSGPCLAGKKTWWQLAFRWCWNRARRPTCFFSASVTRKDLQFGTWTDPSFQILYRFHPTTSGSRSGLGLNNTPS